MFGPAGEVVRPGCYNRRVMGSRSPGSRLADCPGFALTWTAFTVSAFGSYVTSLAVGVLVVLTLGGGATEVGLVSSARWLPYSCSG